VHTLRYYEKIGLLQAIKRDENGYRQFSENDLAWIQFLLRLKATGMPVSEMKCFSDLRFQGDVTIKERRVMLEDHRGRVQKELRKMEENLRLIDAKIEHYKELEHDTLP
jgi:DNA-binding transcriptional MerR regulator